MGKSKSYSRRDFLKASSMASAGLFLSSCTNFQGAFSGDRRNFNDEVVILGAGAAGLAAAYTLKKNKIPYRLFEASARPGGRVYTLENFTTGGLYAELGAETFEESHRHLFQICKELTLETHEVRDEKKLESHLFYLGGKIIPQTAYRKKLKPLYTELARRNTELFSDRDVVLTVENMSQYENSSVYDTKSAEDFIHGLSYLADPEVLDLFLMQVRTRFGTDPSQLSALSLMCALSKDPVLGLQGEKYFYKLTGGLGSLTQNLYERVAGVIPDFMVKVNHALTGVKAHTDGFELEFTTPSGVKSFRTKQVICTLPFSTLRDVSGINSLDFSAEKKELIQNQSYSAQSKAVIEFSEAFWRKKTAEHPAFEGSLSGDFISQDFWDSSRAQDGTGVLLSNLRSGKNAENATALMVNEAVQDLEKIHPGAGALMQASQNFMNWQQRPWQKGAKSFFAPGQYTKYSGVARRPECQGSFLFAGEHTSVEFAGTLEGAVGSGVDVAQSLVKKVVV